MSRHPKAVQDDAEAQADTEAQIEEELEQWDAMYVAMSPVPMDMYDYQYLGPVISNPVDNEADMNSSPEDWREFLRKIEEDLK